MILFLVGLIVFFAVHSVSIVAPRWRDRQAAEFGPMRWRAVYSIASIIGLVLLIKGYGEARATPLYLYLPPYWLRHVATLLLLAVFPLLLAAYFPGRIKAAVGHPMLLAIMVWAAAHLLVNGTVADVLLFGSFLVWARLVWASLKKRPDRPLPGAPPSPANDLIAIGGGLALYAIVVLWAHNALTGVRVFL